MAHPALFARIGETRLRAVVRDFCERVFSDVMIGFFFNGLGAEQRARLIELEYQMTARMLGAKLSYEGRPLGEAHQRARILDGHFARRLQILRETLADHQVPAEVQKAWLEHTESLRSQVVARDAESCMA